MIKINHKMIGDNFMSNIPKVLMQTGKEKVPSRIISMLMSMCPDYEYRHFTNEEAIQFFQNNPLEEFPDIIGVFNNIYHGETKADLFRYYFLYVHGGVYIDTDAIFYLPLENIIHNYDLISVFSTWVHESIFQGFIASVPKHPIIYQNLKLVYNTPSGYIKSNYLITTNYFYHIWMDFINKHPDQTNKLKLYHELPHHYPVLIIDEDNNVLLKHFYRDEKIPDNIDIIQPEKYIPIEVEACQTESEVFQIKSEVFQTESDEHLNKTQLRFHLLGLAHLETNRQHTTCAFTQKIITLAKMLKQKGHKVYFYGVEGSEVLCDEFITVSSKDILRKTYGDYDPTKEFFQTSNSSDLAYRTFNKNAIEAINERKEPKDLLLCTFGNNQKAIADKVGLLTIESGIGYTGVFSPFRVFDSYAWMHHIYGLTNQENGSWYDAVIPPGFEITDFKFQPNKQDYLLYIGGIIPEKSIPLCSDIAKATGNELYIVGQGSIDDLSLGSEKHIRYFPAAGPEERMEFLSNAKAVLMPTDYLEPFGKVNVEAQLCGTPVITSDWGAFPETVLHGVTGFRCRTFEEFCWAVKNIDKIKPQSCRDWAEKNYSLERVGRMYEEYFQRVHRYNTSEQGWYHLNEERQELEWLNRYYPK